MPIPLAAIKCDSCVDYISSLYVRQTTTILFFPKKDRYPFAEIEIVVTFAPSYTTPIVQLRRAGSLELIKKMVGTVVFGEVPEW